MCIHIHSDVRSLPLTFHFLVRQALESGGQDGIEAAEEFRTTVAKELRFSRKQVAAESGFAYRIGSEVDSLPPRKTSCPPERPPGCAQTLPLSA